MDVSTIRMRMLHFVMVLTKKSLLNGDYLLFNRFSFLLKIKLIKKSGFWGFGVLGFWGDGEGCRVTFCSDVEGLNLGLKFGGKFRGLPLGRPFGPTLGRSGPRSKLTLGSFLAKNDQKMGHFWSRPPRWRGFSAGGRASRLF